MREGYDTARYIVRVVMTVGCDGQGQRRRGGGVMREVYDTARSIVIVVMTVGCDGQRQRRRAQGMIDWPLNQYYQDSA